ncbi:MAG: hypothetical protein HYV27_12370 [Candidatus Hydrogenedentes bacterium]|nr:hypothetical protein [Candidatus Hydrogenedentota bacterium]
MVHPGIKWGPFTARIPFIHTRVEWPDLLQGTFVAGATGLAIVPILTGYLGLSFEEAVACVFIQSLILCSAPILFGEPFAPGMVTPALPLMLANITAIDAAGNALYATPELKMQFLTAAALNLSIILFILGITGLGKKFVDWLPPALKGGIIMGAALAALHRVFMSDADRYLLQQPITMLVALTVCMILTFSYPIQSLKLRYRWVAMLAGLGLLPGFVIAAIVGPLTGEVTYEIEWGFLLLPFGSLLSKMSPFSVGFPGLGMFISAFPLSLMTYVILFGDIITGTEVIRAAEKARPDEKIDMDTTRSHLSLAIRNLIQSLTAPFFPYQGALWTGVHVIIVQRWTDGRKSMDSIFSGIHSYYVFGVPILYMFLPMVTALKPLMGIALVLTLVLTGFACAYVAMGIAHSTIERGVIILTAYALAMPPEWVPAQVAPWVGMIVGIVATLTLVGMKPPTAPLSEA